MAITLGLVEAVDDNGVYVSMPGSRGVLRGPYETVQNVTAGDKVLMVTTDDGDNVIVGLAGASVPKNIADPGTVTDNAVVRWDGTSGSAVQNSGVTIDDSSRMHLSTPTDYALFEMSTPDGDAYLVMDGVDPSNKIIQFKAGGSSRFTEWVSGTDQNWFIQRHDDSGTALSNPLAIIRSSGKVILGDVGSSAGLEFGASGPRMMMGTGTPSGVSAPVGSTWRQTDANSTYGNLTGLLWNKVGTGTTLGTDWLVDFEGRWITYTPTWYSASDPQPAVGNGIHEWFFTRRGNTINVKGRLYWGSSTTNGTGGWTWSLPPGVTAISGERYPQNVTVYTSAAGVHTGWVAWEVFGTDRMALLYGSNWSLANGSNPVSFTNLSRIIVDASFIVTA